MNTFAAALTIARKDLRAYLRDRTGIMLGFLLPIVLVTAFGFTIHYAMGGGGGMPKAELWVADEDKTAESRALLEQLRQAEMISLRPAADATNPPAAADLRKKVEDGEAHHALIIEPGFGDALRTGKLPPLTMVRDPGREMEDRVTRISVMQALLAASEGKQWPAAMDKMLRDQGMDPQQIERMRGATDLMQQILRQFIEEQEGKEKQENRAPEVEPNKDARPVAPLKNDRTAPEDKKDGELSGFDFFTNIVPVTNVDIQPPGRPKKLSYMLAQSVCGMTVMMLMFGLTACSSMLLYEREAGTMKRLMAAAIPRNSILLGKFLFSVIVGIIQLVVLLIYGNLLFRLEAFRDVPTLAAVSLTWVVAATSFGMLIASWARTAKQAEGLSTLLILVMAALGGCWFPLQIADLPWAAAAFVRLMPTWWAMSAYQGMFWQQQSWMHPQMLTALGILWGLAIVACSGAVYFFRRRYLAG